jgi:hypothetical protein
MKRSYKTCLRHTTRSVTVKAILPVAMCVWLSEPKVAEAQPASPYGLRRGSHRTLRERRLVGGDGLEPPTSCV